MAAPAPPGVNTLFAEAPSRVWQLRQNKQAFVKEQQKIMGWIDDLLRELSEPFEMDYGGQHHVRLLTADRIAFFKLILRVPPPSEDLVLLFSLRDLYFLGFLHENIWHLFKDARLDGSGYKDEEHLHEWCELPFFGNYSRDQFTKVALSFKHLCVSHGVLTNYLESVKKKPADVAKALYRIIVVISEAKRFPEWLNCLLEVFSKGGSIFAGTYFGDLFQDWSSICKKVIKGPERFEPILCFSTYSKALASVAVLLRGKPKKEKVQEAEFRNPVKQYDPDYDLYDPELVVEGDSSADSDPEEEDGRNSEKLEEHNSTDSELEEQEGTDSEEQDSTDSEQFEEDDGSNTEKSEEEEDAPAQEDMRHRLKCNSYCVIPMILLVSVMIWIAVF